MDSLLLFGPRDERRERLLSRLGYDVVVAGADSPLNEVLSRSGVIDLVLLDISLNPDGVDVCEYLRSIDITRQVPILVVSDSSEAKNRLRELNLDKLEYLEASSSPGVIAGKIATQLRLRKMAGLQDSTASLAEINAALRDLNDRMVKDREEARSIHESLLPESLPIDERFDIAVSYDPLEEVGGDWYFVQKEEEGKISLQIADVTGHGIAAAFIGSMTKLAMTAAHHSHPGPLLQGMNRLMSPQIPPGRFVTMAGALYDPKHGKVQVSLAGHPPVLHVSAAQGTVTPIGKKGFALGMVDDATYAEEEATIERGDLLVFLTDGLSEAQNRSNAMYGAGRLQEVLPTLLDLRDSRAIIKALLKDLEQFCGGRILKDDVTVIILRRC